MVILKSTHRHASPRIDTLEVLEGLVGVHRDLMGVEIRPQLPGGYSQGVDVFYNNRIVYLTWVEDPADVVNRVLCPRLLTNQHRANDLRSDA